MGKVEDIKRQIKALTSDEFASFRQWYAEFEADTWDRDIEADAAAGKLDALAERALAEHRQGKTRPFVKHFASSDFWSAYEALSVEVRSVADRCYELLKTDPRHPSLHFKPVGRFWSVRVGLGHRALAVLASDGYVWFWIGTHAEYDRRIRS